jgi:HPt (histidine-containing phosphotransfer) domain-containing protein
MEQPNKSYIHSLSGGDIVFEQKLIDIIKNEFPTEKEVYFNNMAEKKYKLAADNVHKLKHKISILGLEKSYETAVAFENNLLEGSIELKTEFESILTTITNYLQDL